MESLFKHCKPEHLPNSEGFIRLGSLSDFRRQENQFVRDDGEGTFELRLQLAGEVELSREWLYNITFGSSIAANTRFPSRAILSNNLGVSGFRGELTTGIITVFEDLTISKDLGSHLVASGEIRIRFDQHDSLVFCFSKKESPNSVILDDNYSKTWCLRDANMQPFFDMLVDAAINSVAVGAASTDRMVGPVADSIFQIPEDIALEELQVGASFCVSDVKYLDRLSDVEDENDWPIERVRKVLDYAAFFKPERYCHEEEVRLTITPMLRFGDRAWPIPTELKPVLIPWGELLELTDR